MKNMTQRILRRLSPVIYFAAACLSLLLPFSASADAPTVLVHLDVNKASPRAVEEQTSRRILADYRFAWTNLARAVETDTIEPVRGQFVGSAGKWVAETIAAQQKAGLTSRHINQNHKLTATFYAPEGDVMELHDDAQFHLQVLDGSKLIYDQPVVMHYIVLMTPGADRWVIRQLQSVEKF